MKSKNRAKDEGNVEQIIGREGETATLYERRSFPFGLRVIGFAPRQILCWMSSNFRPIWVKWFSGFQDSEGEMNQFSHCRSDDRHFTFAAFTHSARPLLKETAASQSCHCRKVKRFAKPSVSDF
jgi:hypothetical protein